MEPVERVRWQSTEAYERPESLNTSVKDLSELALSVEMPTANSEWPSIQAPRSAPAIQVLEVFAAAYRDPAPTNAQTSLTTGLATLVDPRFIEVLSNTEPPNTG